jgi:hypothetical protein
MAGINIGGAGIRVSGGGFTPVYGGCYTAITAGTVAAAVTGTDYSINLGTVTEIADGEGVTIVATGGLRNTSGKAGWFMMSLHCAFLTSSAGDDFLIGARVRETDDVTFQSIVIGVATQLSTTSRAISYQVPVYLLPNETVFGCVNKQTGVTSRTITTVASIYMERIA